jgi:shikimate dehydrogenase
METSITGKTRLYALIGCPVSHSISPVLHNSIFAAKKLKNKYITLEVLPGNLREAVAILRGNFGGFNVTIPHKQAIMDHLDEVAPGASLCGAVNTVVNDGGRLIGHNTDGYGFIQAFADAGVDITGSDVVLLGAGGAARAVLCELLSRRCRVTIINRSPARAQKLCQDLSGRFPGTVTVGEWPQVGGKHDLLINTTPVGMMPDVASLPLEPRRLRAFELVYDLVYNPYETALLAAARQCGCQVINGFPMLFYQAVEANRLWTGQPLMPATAGEIFFKASRYLQSLQAVDKEERG